MGEIAPQHGWPTTVRRPQRLYRTIDTIRHGDVKWDSFAVRYNCTLENDNNPAPWKDDTYDVWFRCPRQTIHNILTNLELANYTYYRPFREYDAQTNARRFQDFFSGDWAWEQVVRFLL